MGFIGACLDRGVLPVPAAFSPTEVWFAHEEGAEYLKLFPAQLWHPEVLKAVLGTGSLGGVKIIERGHQRGHRPGLVRRGGSAVGMERLCGQDIKIDPREADQQRAARAQWCDWRANAYLKRFAGVDGAASRDLKFAAHCALCIRASVHTISVSCDVAAVSAVCCLLSAVLRTSYPRTTMHASNS